MVVFWPLPWWVSDVMTCSTTGWCVMSSAFRRLPWRTHRCSYAIWQIRCTSECRAAWSCGTTVWLRMEVLNGKISSTSPTGKKLPLWCETFKWPTEINQTIKVQPRRLELLFDSLKTFITYPSSTLIPSLHNRVFFDACDGFFTNYNWTEESLEFMKDYSGAQSRQADIYVGVDVFARGQVVGGMLETNKVHTVDCVSVYEYKVHECSTVQ